MIIGGVYLGFATETFRRVSIHWKNQKIVTYFLEISYWMIQTCLLFFVLYQVNDGELRVYVFLACILGFSIYVVIFKEIYKRFLEWTFNVILTIVKGIIKVIDTLILRPVKWMIQLIVGTILYVLHVCYHILLFLLKVLFYPLQLLFTFIKKLLPEKMRNNISKTITFCSTIIYKFKKWLKSVIERRR